LVSLKEHSQRKEGITFKILLAALHKILLPICSLDSAYSWRHTT